MPTRQTSSSASFRSALIGASALVVVALVLGADLSARSAGNAGRAGNEFQREALVERPAVRQLTTSLARAVRELVEPRVQGAAITAHLGWDLGLIAPVGASPRGHENEPSGPIAMLLPELLDLPPPVNG